MANILQVAAGHLKNLNLAQTRASAEGHSTLQHQDFVAVAGEDLHPAVPKGPVTYQRSLDTISQRLYGLLTSEQQAASGKIYGKLTPVQALIWITEQENLRRTIVRLAQEEETTRVMNLKELITEIEKTHIKVTGQPFNKAQRQALKAVDDKGLNLRDVIRAERETPHLQRQKEFYDPAIKGIIKMLFPQGKE